MQLFVTILENTVEDAVGAIGRLEADHDGVEVRAERFVEIDLAAIRAATSRPIILTHRGQRVSQERIDAAIQAGIDLIDVEWNEDLELPAQCNRVVLSHHDYKGMHDLERIAAEMYASGCAQTKVAATPLNFADNQRLLRLIAPGMSVIGMGERGLYARILAPFFGSPLTFVANDVPAAPGQLPLERALAIYGPRRADLRADAVFAVVGSPGRHSLSPAIHNALFRSKGVAAAYTIASAERFDEVTDAFLAGEPCGLSVTAPFKEDALAFAQKNGAHIAENAREAGAVNTMINDHQSILADNTDVDGFSTLLNRVCGRDRKSIAIIGAGGTARAALVAARRAGLPVSVFNRSAGKLDASPLSDLSRWDGEIVIDTTPVDLAIPLRAGMTYIRASYGGEAAPAIERARAAGVEVLEGIELLEAQAQRQNELFIQAYERRSR